eukprot:759237-Prorocentrum_lima.AAC.1
MGTANGSTCLISESSFILFLLLFHFVHDDSLPLFFQRGILDLPVQSPLRFFKFLNDSSFLLPL